MSNKEFDTMIAELTNQIKKVKENSKKYGTKICFIGDK